MFSSVQALAPFCCRGKWDSDCLMIDGMVSQLGEQVEKLWQRDEGGTGKYPPVSLHVSVLFTENPSSSSSRSPLKPVSVKVRSPRKPFHLSFQALLDLYLLESIEESDKHAIVSFADFVITPSVCAHKCSSMFVTCVFCAKSFVIQENRFLEIFKIKTSLSFSQNSTQFIIF